MSSRQHFPIRINEARKSETNYAGIRLQATPEKPYCESCIYYGRTTRTCDYILVTGHRRPCPGTLKGKCTARIKPKGRRRK